MVKHILNAKDADKNVIWNGATFRSTGREVYLPESVEMYNPVEEIKIEDEKQELINKCVELGIGATSTLKRNSIETLKKKIEEA